jgi:hypothetical protein
MKALMQGVLTLALGVLIGIWAVGQFNVQLPSPSLPALSMPVVQAQPASSEQDQTAAIQQVVQRGNEAQVEAIKANDPSRMADTSTSAHHQELVQVNQDLLAHGVKEIALLNLEWGPIAIDGQRATATTYETWRTTYEDGTTEQSRDRNDYVLVQEGGSWKVESNTHPEANAPQPGQGSGAPAPRPVPAVPGVPDESQNTSHNWSGYAATNGEYTGVGATWTVPEFEPDRPFGVDAAWVGIGGVRTRDLIQAGTSQAIAPSGATQYQAWVETLPEAALPVPLTVNPGDSVTVTVQEQSQNNWLISFVNNTTGQTYEHRERYNSSNSSAEWVQEAPSTGGGQVLPLSEFDSVSFTDAWTIKNGERMSIADANARAITMVGANNQALAVPSELSADGSSFNVARTDVPASMGPSQPRRGRP